MRKRLTAFAVMSTVALHAFVAPAFATVSFSGTTLSGGLTVNAPTTLNVQGSTTVNGDVTVNAPMTINADATAQRNAFSNATLTLQPSTPGTIDLGGVSSNKIVLGNNNVTEVEGFVAPTSGVEAAPGVTPNTKFTNPNGGTVTPPVTPSVPPVTPGPSPQPPVLITPPAPSVTANDTNNTIVGLNNTMEFNVDNTGYVKYTGTNAPNLEGNHTVLVRVAAVTGVSNASAPTTLSFTTNQTVPTMTGVNVIDGADGVTPVTTPQVGQVIRANITLSDGTTVGAYPVDPKATYKWYYTDSDTVLGTEASYTVTSDNVGKKISVEVSYAGTTGTQTWTAQNPVAQVAPTVSYEFNGFDQFKAGIETAFDIKATATNIPADKNVRYKALLKKDGSAVANQVISYQAAPGEWQTFTTDADGIAYFGPETGFKPADIGLDKGIVTGFKATVANVGHYNLTIGLIDVQNNRLVGQEGSKDFTVASDQTAPTATENQQEALTGFALTELADTVTTAAAAKTVVEEQVATALTDVAGQYTVTISEFVAAVDGTEATPAGTKGSFKATITLDDGETKVEVNGTIAAKAYEAPTATENQQEALTGFALTELADTVTTDTAAQTEVEGQVATALTGVTGDYSVAITEFVAAIDGTEDTPEGTKGSFKATITLDDDTTTVVVTGAIAAKAYEAPTATENQQEALTGFALTELADTVTTDTAAQTEVEGQVATALTGVTGDYSVAITEFVAAIDGTEDTPEGTKGSFKATITLDDDTTTVVVTGAIAAKAFL
ncbi:hypothetical protein [Brevibacillus choshinensis]|uniref:hypothetical protein n=1 Tax=Brevibacillus choshinensis TaxID=54911 RepID=UPI002E227CA8|nr:hypothetical protein [Brevibacillus choshinensis]